MAMYRKPTVSDKFKIPEILELVTCDLIPLIVDYAQLDYDAVMDNYDEKGSKLYPNHTLEQNIVDLGYHQKEFQKRVSFTYTILNKERSECLGCLYMYPCDKKEYDIEIDYWLRDKYKKSEKEILNEIKEWIEKDWQFESILYVC